MQYIDLYDYLQKSTKKLLKRFSKIVLFIEF